MTGLASDRAPAVAGAISPWISSIAVLSATFMVVLDTTVVNVSLSHIAGGLSASVDEATWVLTSYLAANAVILPMTGWLANYFGRKALLIGAVVGFTGASVLCGLAPSLPLLVLFRILQGLSGGTLQPLSQAVMLEAFPPRERGQAMAFWGLGIVVAPMLGPVLGGWLTDNLGWRWVFYINLPVGIVSVIMIMLFIFDPPYIRRRTSRVDYWGIGMLVLGIGALQIALDQGQEEDWFASRWITALAITAAVTLVTLVSHELRTRHPVVDLRVLKVWTYSAGTLLMTVVGFVLFGSMVLLPILVQTLLGYPALQAGIAMAPRGFGSFLAMPIIGMLMMRFDPRKLLVVGLLGTAFTLFQLSWLNLNTGYWDIFWPQFFQGLALGCLFVPLTTVTMDPIPKEEMGNATSIFNVMRNIGGSMGIAATTTYLARRTQLHVNVLGANVSAYDPKTRLLFESIRKGLMGRGSDASTATQQAYRAMFGMVQRQAAMLSFLETFRVLGVVSLVLMPLLLLMRRPKQRRRAAVAE
jgi:DHA2 family multidrug resistance protein